MKVTPHTGVWIETKPNGKGRKKHCRSRPTRACGLKLLEVGNIVGDVWSRPTRACGLKLQGVGT